MAQALLHRGQEVRLPPGLGVEHAVGMQPDRGEPRREQVAPAQAPQDRSFEAREEARREQDGEGASVRVLGRHLMQGAEAKPAAWKVTVEVLDPEGEDRSRTRSGPDGPDPLA